MSGSAGPARATAAAPVTDFRPAAASGWLPLPTGYPAARRFLPPGAAGGAAAAPDDRALATRPLAFPAALGSNPGGLPVPRVSAFRHVHHWHSIPGPHSLIGWDDPSRTGDHYAISRYCSSFSLQFVHLARVIGLFPAHIALGAVAGMLFGLGVRQGIHSMVLTNRVLQGLHAESKVINKEKKPYGLNTPVHLQMLARRNNHVQWSCRYGLLLDLASTVGCAGLGVGTLFRLPLLGEFSPTLLHAALPILTHFFFPLVLPCAVATVERGARCGITFYKKRAVGKHLNTVRDARVAVVRDLYRQRQNELAKYFAMDALARGGLAIGATISVFVGPGGLLLLVPAVLGVIASECFARRILNVDDTFPLKERLKMRTDQDYFGAIVKANTDARSVQALRLARGKRYPFGWGTSFRPFMRLYRKKKGEVNGNTLKSGQTLAAFDRRATTVADGPIPDPVRVMDIMDEGRVRTQYAEAILHNKQLRDALRGHGVTMEKRKWSVDPDAVAMYMMEVRWNPDRPQKVADDLYQLAEEVLLTHGRVELRRRLRALLDYYGRFARASNRVRRRSGN